MTIRTGIYFLVGTVFATGPNLRAQFFLNGDFETNTCPPFTDQINLFNVDYNAFMSNSFSFGTYNGTGDMDILTLPTYGLPQSGSWYVALTGAGTDQISLTVNSPLIAGNSYTISFFDRGYSGFAPQPVQIGLSTVNNAFGTQIFASGTSPAIGVWNQRSFTFTAPFTAQFITIRTAGALGNWTQVDNFSFIGTLPIQLVDITSECEGDYITLSWKTLTETNNSHFTIEESEDGLKWFELGTVPGNGTSHVENHYSFKTEKPSTQGYTYYRIKQTDFDGQSNYEGGVISVNCETEAHAANVYPNPATTEAWFDLELGSTDVGSVILLDMHGKEISIIQLVGGNNHIALPIGELPAGLYFYKVMVNGAETETRKFFKG